MHQSKPSADPPPLQTTPQCPNDTTAGTLLLDSDSQPLQQQQVRSKKVNSKQTPPGNNFMAALTKRVGWGTPSAEHGNDLARLLPGPPNRTSPIGALAFRLSTGRLYSSGELHKLVRQELKSNGFEGALGQVQVVTADFYKSGTRDCIRLDLQGRLGCFSDVLMISLSLPPTTERRPSMLDNTTVTDGFVDLSNRAMGSLGAWGPPNEGVTVNAPDNRSVPGITTESAPRTRVGVLPYDSPFNQVADHAPRGDLGATLSGTCDTIPWGDPPNIVVSSYRTTIISLGDASSELASNSPIDDDLLAKQAESTRTASPSNPPRDAPGNPISQNPRRFTRHGQGGSQPGINPGSPFMTFVSGIPAAASCITGLPWKRRVVELALGARSVYSQTVNTLKTGVPSNTKARYFSIMTKDQADEFVARLKAVQPNKLTVYDPKIRLEDVSVLASIVSSRGSQHPGACRSDSWFLEAMWEGLSRLCHTNQVDEVKPKEPGEAIGVLLDDVMSRFGKRAKKFRSKIRRDATKRPDLRRSRGIDQPDEETVANLKAADDLARKNENLEQEKRRLEERYKELLLTERKLK